MIVGLADRGVAGGLHDVRSLVDHHRRVAGADAVRRLARSVGGLHHGGPAGRDRQIAEAHQFARQRDAGAFDALQQILGRACRPQGGAHDAHDFVGRFPAGRMRRENHRVLAFQRIDGDAHRRDVWTRDRNQRGDDACRLGVFDDPLLGNLLDHAHALLTKRIAQDPEHLGAPARLGAAHAAFSHTHLGQPGRRRLVPARPRHGAAQAIHGGLVVMVDVAHRRSRALEEVASERLFLRCNRSRRSGGDGHWDSVPDYGGTRRKMEGVTVTALLQRGVTGAG